MRITILTSYELASYYALSYLLDKLSAHYLSVFVHNEHRHFSTKPKALQELEVFEEQVLENISFPFRDKIAGGVVILNSINSAEGLDLLESTKPDLIVSLRYGSILKDAAIAIPKCGVINLHSGELPKYKGVMATFRAMLNGDHYAGTTLHSIIDSGIDTGPIISESKSLIDYSHSYLWNVLQLYPQGCQLILDAVNEIQRTGLMSTKKAVGVAAYYSYPSHAEFSRFMDKGYLLFDENEITEHFGKSTTL